MADSDNAQRMLDFYMTDYVLNTLLFTANKEKMLHFEASVKTTKLDNYLALTCTTTSNGNICVGKIFPNASALGGADAHVKASMQFLDSPKATFVDDDAAFWAGPATRKLDLVDNKNKSTKLFSATSTCMYGSLTPKLANSTLYAIVNITSMPFNSFDSPMNDVSSGDLKNLRTIFTAIFEEVFNGIARIRFPLPLVNPSLQLSPRTLYVASNFTYKSPDGFKVCIFCG